jgi:hypothetical protein
MEVEDDVMAMGVASCGSCTGLTPVVVVVPETAGRSTINPPSPLSIPSKAYKSPKGSNTTPIATTAKSSTRVRTGSRLVRIRRVISWPRHFSSSDNSPISGEENVSGESMVEIHPVQGVGSGKREVAGERLENFKRVV